MGVKVALSFLMPAGFGRGGRGGDEGLVRTRGGCLHSASLNRGKHEVRFGAPDVHGGSYFMIIWRWRAKLIASPRLETPSRRNVSLNCFLTVINNAARNAHIQVFLGSMFSFFLRMELLDYTIFPC